MIKNELLKVFNEMYDEGSMQGSFNKGEIAFLYKKVNLFVSKLHLFQIFLHLLFTAAVHK